jgi:hypothetical protein
MWRAAMEATSAGTGREGGVKCIFADSGDD